MHSGMGYRQPRRFDYPVAEKDNVQIQNPRPDPFIRDLMEKVGPVLDISSPSSEEQANRNRIKNELIKIWGIVFMIYNFSV